MDLALDWRAQEYRDTWQARALIETMYESLGSVVLSVMAHNYDDAMPILMRIAFPGFKSIEPPFLCSAGRVAKTGAIVADVVQKNGDITKDCVMFPSQRAMRDAFRRLADRMKLNDADRIEMFKAAQRWVVADRRLDPTMDPRDPDAKRLVH